MRLRRELAVRAVSIYEFVTYKKVLEKKSSVALISNATERVGANNHNNLKEVVKARDQTLYRKAQKIRSIEQSLLAPSCRWKQEGKHSSKELLAGNCAVFVSVLCV